MQKNQEICNKLINFIGSAVNQSYKEYIANQKNLEDVEEVSVIQVSDENEQL